LNKKRGQRIIYNVQLINKSASKIKTMKAINNNSTLPFLEDESPIEYRGFINGLRNTEIDVRDFIQKNYTPYEGDASFLVDSTDTTKLLWKQVMNLMVKDKKVGGIDVDSERDLTHT